MRFTFTGKNITVSESLKERTTLKIGKLKKLIPEDIEVNVTFSSTKGDNKIEVTIPLPKRILRAEVTSSDMYAAIDEIVDILEKQMVKYKQRLRHRGHREPSFKEEYNILFRETEPDEEHAIVIEKTKRFALKPMDPEEAVMEMEMLGHGFYVFRNSGSDEVNVVYRRNNGTYGLIEPEY